MKLREGGYMKDVKQTKKPANKNNKNTSVKKTEAPKAKVKDTKVVIKEVEEIEENFLDDEDDNRLIIFIAIAILVIVATVICLIVGCDKKEVNEPKKPEDDVIVPIEDDKKNDTQDDTKVVVKKTTVKNTTSEDNKESEAVTYRVQFLLNDTSKTHSEKVVSGGKVDKYLPSGYNSCKYYTDENLTQEFNFNNEVNESLNIYMSCELTVYTIVYDIESDNPTTYTVEDGEILLKNGKVDNIFDGWFTDTELTNRIYSLNPSIIKYASDNTIKLYSDSREKIEFVYYDENDVGVSGDTVDKDNEKTITIFEMNNDSVCNSGAFLGWTKTKNSNQIDYVGGERVTLESDLYLYPVCGKAKIVYYNEDEVVTIGVKEEEVKDLELPEKPVEDLGVKAPTYFVKSDVKSDNTKEIIDDSELEIDNNQIRLSDVIKNAGSSYEKPNVGDNVVEKEKVFDGWKQVEKTETIDPETGETLEVTTVIDEEVTNEEIRDQIDPSDDSIEAKTEIELEAKWVEQPEDIAETKEDSETVDTVNEDVATEDVETTM